MLHYCHKCHNILSNVILLSQVSHYCHSTVTLLSRVPIPHYICKCHISCNVVISHISPKKLCCCHKCHDTVTHVTYFSQYNHVIFMSQVTSVTLQSYNFLTLPSQVSQYNHNCFITVTLLSHQYNNVTVM